MKKLSIEKRETLEIERTKAITEYNNHVIDWKDRDSIKKSGDLYNKFHEIARRLDLH